MDKKRKKINEHKIYRYGVFITVLLLTVLSVVVLQRNGRQILVPDMAPENTEQYIEAIPNDTGQKPDKSNGGSVSLTYSDGVTVDVGEEIASLYFANPGRSDQDMILRIVVRDEVLVQSGLIPAGYRVKKLALLPDSADWLMEGSHSGKFEIYYYDQGTGRLATVNTEIPITVIVEK